MRRNKFGKYYCKIALTGGPCAGKTTSLGKIAVDMVKVHPDWQVFRVAEAATLLSNGGVFRKDLSGDQLLEWQEGILLTILRLEDVYERIAMAEQKRNTLLICDRGGLDAKVYAETEHWSKILLRNSLSENELLYRYDAVLHLRSAPEIYYTKVTNTQRRESFHEAKVMDEKYVDVWKNHFRYNSIDNGNGGFDQKIDECVQIISQLINEIREK
uniref:NadR/Ttd14 AAA domain-containing protein n=1 Tax=Plectus sambesii TaxID=2011161 RepID=A0A914XLX8_9BILA